jgi:hypothetical protein
MEIASDTREANMAFPMDRMLATVMEKKCAHFGFLEYLYNHEALRVWVSE